MALELDEIQSTTRDFWLPGAIDQYYNYNILTYRLLRKSKKISGGVKIRQVLHYGKPKGGAFGPDSTFNTQRYDDHNAARFDWAAYYEPCTYGLEDKIQNSGPQAEVDIVMSKLNMMQEAIQEKMAEDLYSNKTKGATWPMTGLLAMINSTSSTAYGTIAEDDMGEWAPGAVTTTEESLTLPVMRTLRRNCKIKKGATGIPTIYITTDTLEDTFKGLLQPQQRFQDDKLASAGFSNVMFESKPLVADYYCPSGYMFALNENYMGFKTHQDFDFHHEPWMRPTDQYKFTMQVIWSGNLVCSRRDAHGYHSNLS